MSAPSPNNNNDNTAPSLLAGNKRKQPDPPEELSSENVAMETSSVTPLTSPERKKEKLGSSTVMSEGIGTNSSEIAMAESATTQDSSVTTASVAVTTTATAIDNNEETTNTMEICQKDISAEDQNKNSSAKEESSEVKTMDIPSSSGENVNAQMKDIQNEAVKSIVSADDKVKLAEAEQIDKVGNDDGEKRVHKELINDIKAADTKETDTYRTESDVTSQNMHEINKVDDDVQMKEIEVKTTAQTDQQNTSAPTPTHTTTQKETKDQKELIPYRKDGKINWDIVRSRLSIQSLSTFYVTLSELRDDYELLHSSEYPTVLATLVPLFMNTLKTLPCRPPDNPSQSRGVGQSQSHTSNDYINRVRNGILECCNNFPFNETLRPYSPKLMTLAIDVLKKDYEDNALLASKIIVELHKNYRQDLINYAEPYLDFVLMSYRTLNSNLQKNLTWKGSDHSKFSPSISSQDYFLKSAMSFKVLTECPLTVILIFQLYPKFIKTYLMQLLPLMMEALGKRPPPPPPPPPSSSLHLSPSSPNNKAEATKDESKEGNKNTRDFQIQQEAMFTQLYYKRSRELLSAQVRTLTFITFLLSRYGEQMKPYEDHLATNVLNLFQMCPREAISTRKDLLLALKHIFVTDFRKGFYKHIDLLLDDRVLIGKHKQSEHTNLRVEAYGALATLIPHVCSKLTLIQISRVVLLYSRVLHDASMNLPSKSQMISINLLLSMVDTIYQNKDEKASFGRDILYRIFVNLVWKMRHLVQHDAYKTAQATLKTDKSQVVENDQAKNNLFYRNRLVQMYGDESSDNQYTITDTKCLIKMIIPGFKKLIWCMNSYGAQREKIKRPKSETDKTKTALTNNQHNCSWYEEMAIQTMSANEQKLVDNCLVWSLEASQILKDESLDKTEEASADFRNALDSLASALVVLDSFSFQRVVGPRVGMVVDSVVKDPDAIVMIEKFLLNSSTISPTFASCLLKYLMQNKNFFLSPPSQDENFQRLPMKRRAEVMQQLFEILFSSLAVYKSNEFVLRPHLQSLIAICLRHTTNSDEIFSPGINLEILRKLFRAIAGGKFEESYKEILPLLSPLLNGLYRISNQTESKTVQKVVIELCLTIPARLSSLLPHLPLLLRVIVPALQTDDGELINLGLRTLEFWVDNLNAEFLLPVLSRDSDLFSELMLALTEHLRPAPYQYGLLTLRLLGKLGGKNRLFLQHAMDLPSDGSLLYGNKKVQMECKWNDSSTVLLPMPLSRAVFILEKLSIKLEQKDHNKPGEKEENIMMNTMFSETAKVEDFDLLAYKSKLLDETTQNQGISAFTIVRGALSAILTMEDNQSVVNYAETEDLSSHLFFEKEGKDTQAAFILTCKGIVHATNIHFLKDQALELLEGLMHHLVLSVAKNLECYRRSEDKVDLGATKNNEDQCVVKCSPLKETQVVSGKLQPLPPFGNFIMLGKNRDKYWCLMFNQVLPKILQGKSNYEVTTALSIIENLVDAVTLMDEEMSKTDLSSKETEKGDSQFVFSCKDIVLENLLHILCEACFSLNWQSKRGIYKGICKLLERVGPKWSCKFEVVLLHTSIFCLKDYPKEIVIAEKDTISFFFEVLSLLYSSKSSKAKEERIIDDIVVSQTSIESFPIEPNQEKIHPRIPDSKIICSLLIGELCSQNSIVRMAVRSALKFLYGHFSPVDPNSLQNQLSEHESTIKKLLFSKSLRNLSVSEQIATIETFSFIAKCAPNLLPLSENLVLVFFSELLKMMSVADGEMKSESISNAVIINKDGYNPNAEKQRNSCMVNAHSSLSHASGIFLRNEYDFFTTGIGVVVVPAELPVGIQFRVSSLILFHCVLRAHSDTFFDADPTSSIGNILPHIVSLLFRSLTSRPEPAVDAAHAGLRDILNLSSKSKNKDSPHRLPKNLLQMCIRPVLLNLRDYTKLTIPLLRGLSRLLSLLSSWFSKTLGEKLLEHLQRWTDPEKIMGLNIWKRGEEPLVAATIIGLFELLPDDSHFVELLVKTTLKLENALPRYKYCCLNESPFRLPLAKYLNKHGEATASFFVNDHRLKNPIYSDLLQDILKRPESEALRKKLSDSKWSTILLNVCFEKPLAIIRAEKGSSATPSNNSPRNAADILSMHGINIDLTGHGQKCTTLRQVLEQKKEKLQSAKKEETRVNDRIEKLKKSEVSATPQRADKVKRSITNAQRQLEKAQLVLGTVTKEVEIAQKEYNDELSKIAKESERTDPRQSPRSMTFDALELQHQGFCLVETLIENDSSYIREHTDVVRAFRWLWRSKGRHFRLFHEDSMPPRFNGESIVLARFLINFAKTSNDVDILFDLLRIFLQPTSSDFSFVQDFLKDTVCNVLSIEQKKRVMQRFFPVIASEGIEELKVLSIQFLILPMLKNDLLSSFKLNKKDSKAEKIITVKNKDPMDSNNLDDPISNNISQDNPINQSGNHEPIKSSEPSHDCVLDSDLTGTFIKEVLLQGGKSRSFGSRLNIELLRLSSLLLEFVGDHMQDQHRQGIIKFAWGLLRHDDLKTKQWACISICHYISSFPTPPKSILQIYATILRSHHQQAKELANIAMDLLLPSLSKRLSIGYFSKVFQYTIKTLYEEGNSIQSLSHVCHIIVRHEATFYSHRMQIVPHLVVALNKIGLSMNSSPENRALSISMVDMIFRWEEYMSQQKTFADLKSNENCDEHMTDTNLHNLFHGVASPETSPMKTIYQMPKLPHDDGKGSQSFFALNKTEVETIVNFLVRFILLVSPLEKEGQLELATNAQLLLRTILQKWPDVEIRSVYFDRVESLCLQERQENDCIIMEDGKRAGDDDFLNKKMAINRNKEKGLSAIKKKVDSMQPISESLLASCIEIFSSILEFAPSNCFLRDAEVKCCTIVLGCFDRLRDSRDESLRKQLRCFLRLLFNQPDFLEFTQEMCISYLESILLDSFGLQNGRQYKAHKSESNNAALFFLKIVNDISFLRPNVPELMSNTLVNISDALSKSLLTNSSSKRATASSTTPFASPLVAIVDEILLEDKISMVETNRKSDKDPTAQYIEKSTNAKSLISCIRLIGKSLVATSFTKQRQKFISILNDILDFSSNIRLLLATTVMLGTWLSNEKSVFTLKETLDFVTKLTALEYHGLPEVESQPLFHAIALVVLNVHKRCFLKAGKEQRLALDQSLIGCIMVTNQRLRALITNMFLCTLNGDTTNGSVELEYGILGQEENANSIRPLVCNDRPMEILDKLISSSFDSLGSRLWTFVIVDILLSSCKSARGIIATSVKHDIKNSKADNIDKSDDRVNTNISSFEMILHDRSKYDSLIERYKLFLCSVYSHDAESSYASLLDATRTLACCDTELCQELLESLMTKAWACSNNEERINMIPNLEKLLTRPSHVQFLKNSAIPKAFAAKENQRYRDINSIQMMLRAVEKLTPTPMIAIEAMLYLAKHYNCWHEVRRMMELQLKELKKVPKVLSSDYYTKLESSIRRCYLELGELDVWMTMKSDSCSHSDIKWAVSLDMYGNVSKAVDAFCGLVDEMDAYFDEEDGHVSTTSPALSELEISFVEDRWIALHREMSQMAVLGDFAHDNECIKLSMECAWKSRDWKQLRSLCSTPSVIALLESGDIDVKMSEIFLAIADGKLHEVENLHAQTAQLCLYKWQLLPHIYSGCCAHNELLHNFHRLVDIRESGQIMVETSNHAGGKTYPDLKNLLNVWRHRLPNDFDPLYVWDDIFQWRSHMYTAITTKFHWAEQGTLATLHDRPWTALKMAKVARKQDVPEVALLSLARLTDCAMDVSDAFSKLREQILSFRNGSEFERTGGLNLINTTNLDYFDSNQKGELIRLKAEFLESLGAKTKATQAYCHAVQLCPYYAKSWTSWGELCNSLADIVDRQSRAQAAEKKMDKEKMNSNAKKIVQYLAQSMGCFLEAVQCESSSKTRAHIPKCLQMLSKDGSSPGLLCSTFEKHATKLPSWVWLTWIPQLLSSLCRIEARGCKEILLGILTSYPQAIYYSLRSFYLECRDLDRSRSSDVKGGGSSGVEEAEELMSCLRKYHPTLWVTLESILEELIIRFRPSYEEELMTTITALLQRAESQVEHKIVADGKESEESAVHASFAKTLFRVSAKFFRSSTDPSSFNQNDERSRKSTYFTLKYKDMFEKDFLLVSSSSPSGENDESKHMILSDIIIKLKKWKHILEMQVALSPSQSPLLQISPALSAVSNSSPDLWCGACVTPQSSSRCVREKDSEESPSTLSTVESMTAATTAAIAASQTVALANSYEGRGGQYGGGCSSMEIPGQYSPNVADDRKPSPEINAKLIKFESYVEVSRQNDQFVRRIGMVGSDGKRYQFLLQFAVPYWTRTDERTAQLHQIFGQCFRNSNVASRRNLWFKPTAVVPIAQRLRMTAEASSNTSLHDIYLDYCFTHGMDPDDAARIFHEECKQNIDDSKTQEEKELIKVAAFEVVCKSISPDILVSAMHEHFSTAEKYFFFQRSFASQLALNSLLQYAFDVNERSPHKLAFNTKNGHVLSPDFRFSYSNQGFLDDIKPVPFRLTRNISEFIGPNLMKGIFKPSLASAASAICAQGQTLLPALHLLCRDDIVSWYLSKSSQRDGHHRSTQDLERNLSDRIKKNVYVIQTRLRECAPSSEKEKESKTPIDDNVEKLMAMATKDKNLVSMPLSYCPWL